MTAKNVTVHYRKLDADTRASLGHPLHQAITRAMERRDGGVRLRDDWNLRAELLADNDRRFLNNYDPSVANAFGTLLLYEQDAAQALISNMGHVANVEVAQEAPDDGEQFLKGILYWLAIGDHLFAIQTSSLRLQSFEQHLTWLFKQTGSLPDEDELVLTAEFDRAAIGGDLDVKRVAVHGRIVSPNRYDAMEANPDLVELERTRSLAAQRGLPVSKEKAWSILKAFYPSGDTAEQLYNQIPEDGELDYNFELMLKTKDVTARRRFNQVLQRDLRDADEGQVKAMGTDGTVSGDDIRLHLIMPVEMSGNLLELRSAREAMLRVYERFVQDNKIQA